MSIEKTLHDRRQTHGDFDQGAEIFDQLMALVYENRKKFTKSQRYGLTHIMGKLTRILSGNPNEADHWQDVAGYAALVVKSLERVNDDEKVAQCDCRPIVVNHFKWGERF